MASRKSKVSPVLQHEESAAPHQAVLQDIRDDVQGKAAADHNHTGVYEPVVAAGTAAQYYRGDKTWQTTPTNTWVLNIGASAFSPADAATLYFGTTIRAPVSTAQVSKMFVREACTLVHAELLWVTAAVAGTNENITVRIVKNNTAATVIQTIGSTANPKVFSNTGLDISLAAGDFIECQILCPTWATNPTNVVLGGYLKFQS